MTYGDGFSGLCNGWGDDPPLGRTLECSVGGARGRITGLRFAGDEVKQILRMIEDCIEADFAAYAEYIFHPMMTDPDLAHLPLVSYVEPDLSIVSVEYA